MIRYPYLTGDVASNKPDASTAYNLAGSGLAGARTFAAALTATDIASGDELLVYAYKFDADGNPTGAWEICWCTFTDATPDTLTRGTLAESSTGSKIDWSTATGEDFSPRLEVVGPTSSSPRLTQSAAMSGAASYDVAMRAKCDYLVLFDGIDLSDDQISLGMKVSTDGTNFDGAAANYKWGSTQASDTSTIANTGSTSATEMLMSTAAWFGNADVTEEISGCLWIRGAGDSGVYTKVSGEAITQSYLATSETCWRFHGARQAAQADIALRLYPTAGTMSGNISVWEFERP